MNEYDVDQKILSSNFVDSISCLFKYFVCLVTAYYSTKFLMFNRYCFEFVYFLLNYLGLRHPSILNHNQIGIVNQYQIQKTYQKLIFFSYLQQRSPIFTVFSIVSIYISYFIYYRAFLWCFDNHLLLIRLQVWITITSMICFRVSFFIILQLSSFLEVRQVFIWPVN